MDDLRGQRQGITAPDCAIGYAFKAIEGKWRLPVMYVLRERGTMRYNEIKRELAITNAMLSTTLKGLESYGLVDRIQYNEVPPRVEYSLTADGRAIAPALLEFERWGQRLLDAKETADAGAADGIADDGDTGDGDTGDANGAS